MNTGIIITVVGLVYGFLTTHFHGWNGWPQSSSEWITDGIMILIVCLGSAVCEITK